MFSWTALYERYYTHSFTPKCDCCNDVFGFRIAVTRGQTGKQNTNKNMPQGK